MDINNIIKVKFLKSGETLDYDYLQQTEWGSNIIETDIEFNDLLKLINDVEEKRELSSYPHRNYGKALHQEAFTGIDYLGNDIKFSY
jgi:hypothetical protein